MAVERIAAEIKSGKDVDGSVLALMRQWLKATIVEPTGIKRNPRSKRGR